MTDTPSRLSDRAAELRLAFDHSFAEPPRLEAAPEEDLLGIRLAAQPYAIRLSEITGLHAGNTITRVPSGAPALLGLVGFRGAILPVYGLNILLGYPMAEKPRWLTVASGAPIALALEGFDGHLRVSRDAILQQEGDEPRRLFVREFARAGGIVRPIVHLASVLDAIRKQPQDVAAMKER